MHEPIDTPASPLRRHAADALRRARRLPIGHARNDLRQLALGLLWLEKRGFVTIPENSEIVLKKKGIAVAAPAVRNAPGPPSHGDTLGWGLGGMPGAVQNSLPIGAPSVRSPTKGRPASVNRRAYLADYDDQPTLRFSADSLPRFATTS